MRGTLMLVAIALSLCLLPRSAAAQATTAVQLAKGDNHACILQPNGGARCWGLGTSGQLGGGDATSRSSPISVPDFISSGLVYIAARGNNTCAIKNSGQVVCWGANNRLQVGSGATNAQYNLPTDSLGATSAVSVAPGLNHTCSVMQNGSMMCWGHNNKGQLADTSINNRIQPQPVQGLAGPVVAAALGDFHTCAIVAGGTVQCWGSNDSGQVGDNGDATTPRTLPVTVSGLAGVTAITAGAAHTCVVANGGVKCWGRNAGGELGLAGGGAFQTPVDVPGLEASVESVNAGSGTSTCATFTNGSARCWGGNGQGLLGFGHSTAGPFTPAEVAVAREIVAAMPGTNNTCALMRNGGVRCWGNNTAGELGANLTPSPTASALAVEVFQIGGPQLKWIATGPNHSCAVTSAGAAKCWGKNNKGQLGNNTTTGSSSPVDVSGLASGVAAIAVGTEHSCAVLTTGAVKCWGSNFDFANAQANSASTQLVPADVPGVTDAVSASLGQNYSCVRTAGSGLRCWGSNRDGQLGFSGGFAVQTPASVTGLTSGVASLTAGSSRTCATLATGGSKCWGTNISGSLGVGIAFTLHPSAAAPEDVVGLGSGSTAAITSSHSGNFACAALQAGGAKCWGDNGNGQLGTGTTGSATNSPTATTLTGTANSISAGGSHVCASMSDGSVKCWGGAGSGEMGTPTQFSVQSTPIQANIGYTVMAPITSGGRHTCVRTTSGGAKCWGENTDGAFGAGTGIGFSFSPVGALIGPNAIAFNPPATTPRLSGAIALTASSPAGTVTFASMTPAICTVSGTTLTPVAYGNCLVRATQAGNSSFYAAVNVSRVIAIVKTPQSVSFALPEGKVYGDAPFAVAASGGGSGNAVTFASATPAVCTVTGTNTATVTILRGGDCTIVANQAGNSDYQAAPAAASTTFVNRAAQAITFNAPGPKVIGTAPFLLSGTATSGLTVAFQSVTTGVCATNGASGELTALLSPGLCTVNAMQFGDDRYLPADTLQRSFQVMPLPPPRSVLRGDFDGGGTSDIVIRDASTGVAYAWLMNGLTVASGGYLLDAGSGWRVVKVADFNDDGKADILIQHTDGSVYMRLMDALNVIGGGYVLGAGTGYTVTHVADFNGDGKADVLFRHANGSIYLQTMDGVTATAGTFVQGAASGWTVTHVADFNGDGNADLLMTHTDGSIYVQLMNGVTAIDGTYLLGAGSGWSATITGDFNGDRKADILITHANGGVYLWQMNGTAIATGTYLLSPASGWSIADTGDLDGDGKSDILIEHTDGSLYAWMMDGLDVVNGAYLLGAASGWSLSHVRDLNGDGMADILLERADGSIYGWIMNGTTIVNGTYLMGAGSWRIEP